MDTKKYKNLQIQETPCISYTGNMKKTTPRHVMTKLLKTTGKEKILRATSGENGGIKTRMTVSYQKQCK